MAHIQVSFKELFLLPNFERLGPAHNNVLGLFLDVAGGLTQMNHRLKIWRDGGDKNSRLNCRDDVLFANDKSSKA